MNPSAAHPTWVEVDLGAIETNTRQMCHNAGCELMAVVKANAYGHGAIPVAKAALRGGASWLGVARVSEALELRQAGLEVPILLLGYTPPAQGETAILNRLSMTVWDLDQVRLASETAQRLGLPARLHLKVDTGMGRLGVQPGEVLALAHVLSDSPGVLFEGIFTHFARADERDRSSADRQEQLFAGVLATLEQAGLHLPPWIHAANSAAGLARPIPGATLARAGIALYGLHPSIETPLPASFRPALAWKAILSHVKELPPGSGVSYGHAYVTRGRERIGTLPVGYADGFRRLDGNQVLICGRRVPVIGRVCMDQAMVLLDTVPEAKAGDEAVLIGMQGKEWISAEEVGRSWGTINYEVVCGISNRVPRSYPNPV